MSPGWTGIFWSHPSDSNRRPADYESAALPAELGWLPLSVERTSEYEMKAELLRLKGQLLLLQTQSNSEEAERWFRSAIDIARGQQAKSWELHATTSLARLLANQHRRDEGRTMLAEIYNWFIEGFDTADLKEAKMLLDELSC